MKKVHRERALNELFARLQSADFDRREHALFQLALLLQRSNHVSSDAPAMGSESLPRELTRIRLSPEEQRQVVDKLSLLVASRHESRPTAFWTLGEVAATSGWEPTLALLNSCGAQLDTEAAYQACRALRRWLDSGALSSEQVESSIAAFDLVACLHTWSEKGDKRLSLAAKAVIEFLHTPRT